MYRLAKPLIAALFLSLGLGAAVGAQDWPTKTVRVVVPFGPGSTPDIVARLVAEGLQQKYPGSTFLVENKPGASGNLGTDIVAKAAPDGSTLGVSIGGPLAINTLLFSRLPYDPRKDIAPCSVGDAAECPRGDCGAWDQLRSGARFAAKKESWQI
jgi:tripartite-type tricarboxylate transporter receptor subunit TctC